MQIKQEDIRRAKSNFGIIGNNSELNLAIERALKVADTDLSVLITGDSGVGKEALPKVIHHFSGRRSEKYIAVNCGAIPEGTIDSELFGHEKGAFTGATNTRSGYFEVADGGTVFLDEVGELPLATQVRLLRVLETGEFLKVGSSKTQKTNVRIVAATNVKMRDAIQKGKFREDLYYRLSTVEINLPPLRDRKEDIPLLFRKFASDFAQKYHMPTVRLNEDAQMTLSQYNWNGNIRQLRNVAEQISVLEKERELNSQILRAYLPDMGAQLPVVRSGEKESGDFASEREILYKVLFDMKNDLNDLKKLTLELMKQETSEDVQEKNQGLINKIYGKESVEENPQPLKALQLENQFQERVIESEDSYDYAETITEEEPLSLLQKEIEMIKRALERSQGKRKLAAEELGISERTLYRKIKQYDLNEGSED